MHTDCFVDYLINVDWTNVNLIVGICSRCSLEGTFKILSKFGSVTAEIFLIWTTVEVVLRLSWGFDNIQICMIIQTRA